MLTLAVLVGSAIFTSIALTGSSYVAKYIDDQNNDPDVETKRHDLAEEKFDYAREKYQERKENLEDWEDEQEKEKENAENLSQSTIEAFKYYNKMSKTQNLPPPPNFNDYYQPSETQKNYELIFLGLGGFGLTYFFK